MALEGAERDSDSLKKYCYADGILNASKTVHIKSRSKKNKSYLSESSRRRALSKSINAVDPLAVLLSNSFNWSADCNSSATLAYENVINIPDSKKTSYGGVTPKSVRRGAIRSGIDIPKRNYRSTNTTAELPATEVGDRSTRNYCVIGASNPKLSGQPVNQDDICGGSCCSENHLADFRACTRQEDATAPTDLKALNARSSVAKTLPHARIANSDIEKGLLSFEHVVLSVQGMTCAGCEKKLQRSLESLPAVSNIKTSLILARAEFDLCGSIPGLSISNVIEKMTGFTCTNVVQSGVHLDMIVDDNVNDIKCMGEWPFGVMDLVILNKTSIRVTYDPKNVGARDLLSNPFFKKAKLAPVALNSTIASNRAHTRRILLSALLSMLLTIPVLTLAWAPLPKHEILYGAISLGLATIVQIVIAGQFYGRAFQALVFSRMIEMDLLIVLSTSSAFTYSVIAYGYLVTGNPLSTGQFFETSTLLVTLMMGGRFISTWARQKAIESISTTSIQKTSTLLVDSARHQVLEVDTRLLQYQDIFRVMPDTSIVTDGIVIAGETKVDESLITGEAKLITKKPGMSVIAGSINQSGILTVALTRLPHENTLQTIELLVDKAKLCKPPIQKIADRVASIFIPVILAVTVLIFIIWVTVGVARQQESAATAGIIAMTYSISVLIVSCPCAVGLAVPMAVAIAGGIAAKHGLVFKSSGAIEVARKISHVVFDKTGTLTHGKLVVVAESYPTNQFDMLAPVIAGLTASSKHPVSIAVAAHMKALGIRVLPLHNAISVVSNGIKAKWQGRIICAGNPYWLGVDGLPLIQKNISKGLTLLCVTLDGDLVATFGLRDSLRDDAIDIIGQLKRRSIKISIISGDNEEAVRSIARVLDIPQSHVRFRCTPTDKQQYVADMLRRAENRVMFCGDGTNDAGALAQASIGMHINGGTDIAQNAADVILMRPSLSSILVILDLSKAFHRCIILSFFWSFSYNVIAILLAAGAFPSARVSPQFAGLGEVVSVLPVIAITMLLRLFRFKGTSGV